VIETLTEPGRIHWGVMLAQGWKGELASASHEHAWPVARDWAIRAEDLGFDGIWVFDHFQPYPARDNSPVLEAWTALAALAQVTNRVALGTLVSCAACRPPAVTVKMAQNLQVLSGGRFCFGVGAGWDEPEYDSLGIPFGTAAERSDQLEELLRRARPHGTCRELLAAREQPEAGPQPLLLVGGDGEKRTLPAAVKYADLVNWQVGPQEFARKSRILARLCEAVGRDQASLRRTHAPNFQLFESEREFRRWRQHPDRYISAKEVDVYIRNRGALYGTSPAITETIDKFVDIGCQGFMIYCNVSPVLEALESLSLLVLHQASHISGAEIQELRTE
jgi:alkanesulfonate monooxygenase SsuD/methylene tetrahydromethanopterin reductase-like flavin-dependent oxidoreductase (luciferase family)